MTWSPKPATAAKYGLTVAEAQELLALQGNVCAVCKIEHERYVIDHEHVKGWKKMGPSDRRKYVRGIICWYANYRFLARGMSIEKSRSITDYLVKYEKYAISSR